jgi:general stress protein YciG
MPSSTTAPAKPRGFAAMTEAKKREIAAMGGRASGGNFKHNRAKASAAGKKSSGNFANNREKARAAGRKGGSRPAQPDVQIAT